MFFVVSKLLVFLIRPLTWVMFCGLWAVFTRDQRRRKILLLSLLLVLFVFGNGVLFNEVAHAWERRAGVAQSVPDKQYRTAIVLGGYASWDAARSRAQLTEAADRLYYPIALYHGKKVQKILLTGGSGSLMQRLPSEALYARELLRRAGIHDSDIIIESASRNTFENAVFSKKICDSLHLNGANLLITSASHMPRAAACFKKAGFIFTTYPVHYLSRNSDSYELKDWLLPGTEVLFHWEMLIKEWVGVLAYKLSGKI